MPGGASGRSGWISTMLIHGSMVVIPRGQPKLVLMQIEGCEFHWSRFHLKKIVRACLSARGWAIGGIVGRALFVICSSPGLRRTSLLKRYGCPTQIWGTFGFEASILHYDSGQSMP